MQPILTTRRYLITGSQRLSNYLWAFFISLGGVGFLLTGFISFLETGVPEVSQNVTAPLSDSLFLSQASESRSLPLFIFNKGIQVVQTGFSVSPNLENGFGLIKGLQIPFGLQIPLGEETLYKSTKTIAFFPQGLTMCFYGALGLLFGLYLWCTVFWKVGNGFNEFNKDSGIVRIFRWGLPGKTRRIDLTYKIKEIEGLRVELTEGINPRRIISLQIKGKGQIPLTRIGQPLSLEDIESEASELAQFLQVSLETFYKI